MDSPDLLRFRRAYWRAARELDTVRLRLWERSHVTLPQLRVLYHIRRAPGITTGELSRALGVTVSTTSGLVIKLVERGQVARTTTPGDRRQAPLSLTEDGAALVGELTDVGRPFLNRVAAELGGELDAVTAALERLSDLAARVRADEPDPTDDQAEIAEGSPGSGPVTAAGAPGR
jgi:DNA-binding MarR family transcriptional regulator